jgi:hypothetical protein
MMAQTLQMELGSSVPAALVSLERMLAEPGWEPAARVRLKQFRDQATAVGGDAKSLALLGLLGSWPEKLLIFTRFRLAPGGVVRVLNDVVELSERHHADRELGFSEIGR